MTRRVSDEDIDRALAADEAVVPTSGLATTVMARIRQQAAAPPPIPFPWLHALPGIVALVLVAVAALHRPVFAADSGLTFLLSSLHQPLVLAADVAMGSIGLGLVVMRAARLPGSGPTI
jgi:hypothetical protein